MTDASPSNDGNLIIYGQGLRILPRFLLNERLIAVGVSLASGLILFFNHCGRTLENHDYLRYAEVAREIIRSGEWVVLHYNGEIYIDKPPLLFWLIALPSWFYGSVTPLLARLPSVLAAWIGVMTLFLWSRRIHGTIQSGLVSGGLLLTTYQYFFQARSAKTDMLLCVMVLLSLYFFYMAYEGVHRNPVRLYGLSFFFMGLGVLAKGPFGIVIPMAVMTAFLLKERRTRVLVSRPFLLGYVILGITVLPWVALFVKSLGWEQTLSLIKANQILTRRAPVYFYFIEIWFEFFPWSLLIPGLFLYFWRKRRDRLPSVEVFLLIWFVLLFLLLTFFEYRASRYLLPALPPMALMMGGMWKKKLSAFFIAFGVTVLIWHGVELNWLRRNLVNSPGKVLTGELVSLPEGAMLSGFRLDVGTIEEINFYLDRVIPIIKKAEHLPGKKLILMPEKAYRKLILSGYDSIQIIREFQYKEGRLFLVSS